MSNPPIIDFNRAQREELRWRMLRTLDAGRPRAVSETLLLRVAHDVDLPVISRDVRNELLWLQDISLIKIENPDELVWLARLTAYGVNVVDYTDPCPAGIARPPKFWG